MRKKLAAIYEQDFAIISGILFSLKWIVLASFVAIPMGLLGAFFLNSLNYVTNYRTNNPNIIFLLPLGGALISFLYVKLGKNSTKGTNLILEQIEYGDEKEEKVPSRLAPLTLIGTITTHLLGGSVGREGTAVQMGGSVADTISRVLELNKPDRKTLLLCGISSGFGAVFGTPLAGTIFAMEVISIGKMHSYAIFPCFVSAFLAEQVTTAVGTAHTHYEMTNVPEMSLLLVIKIILASIAFGLCSILFSKMIHFFRRTFDKVTSNVPIKSFIGGIVIIALAYIFNTRDYMGLGIPIIKKALEEPLQWWTFLLKLLFTTITLGAGFQGGEVTPLFFIGATLGNALGQLLSISPLFLASLGFVAVFAGATNTPLACFIMGIELFHGKGAIFLFIACIVSYLFSGHHGIYASQHIHKPKYPWVKASRYATISNIRKKRIS